MCKDSTMKTIRTEQTASVNATVALIAIGNAIQPPVAAPRSMTRPAETASVPHHTSAPHQRSVALQRDVPLEKCSPSQRPAFLPKPALPERPVPAPRTVHFVTPVPASTAVPVPSVRRTMEPTTSPAATTSVGHRTVMPTARAVAAGKGVVPPPRIVGVVLKKDVCPSGSPPVRNESSLYPVLPPRTGK